MKSLSGKFRKDHSEILIFSFFILLSIVATYPLIFRMRNYLYGLGGDALGTVSELWRIKYAHLNPSLHSLIAYPYGINLAHTVRYILWEGLLLPLAFLFNEIFAYNFFILTSFFFSAIVVYYLVYYFTKNKSASIVSGIIYTLCPYHFAHSFYHLTLPNIQWMPLYALTLFKLDEEKSYRWAFLAALAFSLVFLSDYYYGYFMVVFTVAFVVWGGWFGLRRKSKVQSPKSKVNQKDSLLHTCKVVLVAVIVAVAIILPFTYSIFKTAFFIPKSEEVMSKGYVRPFTHLFSNSARPLGYLLPSQDNLFFGRFTKRFIKSPFYGGHPTEHTLYLGWVGIVLSIVAIRAWRRKNKKRRAESREQVRKWESGKVGKGETENGRNGETGKVSRQAIDYPVSSIQDPGSRIQKGVSFFLFAGIVALLFSHSPWTEIGPFRILFPSYFMYKILPMFRVCARFGIVVMLCVSVLAGIGLASILKKIKNAKRRRIFLAIVLLLIFIEFAPPLPAPMVNAVNPPPVYGWLAKQEGDFIIAEYPLENDVEYLFWQRIHQRRLVNGAQSGTYADEVRKEIVDILKPETPGILSYLGTKYVILHPDKYLKSEDVPVIGEVPDVGKQKGLKLIKTFKKAQVYEIIAEPMEPVTKV